MLFQELSSPALRDSIGQMNLLQQRLNRLLSNVADSSTTEFPPLNVWASEDKVVVVAEVPGIDPNEIDVQIINQALTLKTSREPEQLGEGQTWHRQERGYGQFTRTFELPYAVDTEKVRAACKDGMLRIELPRTAADLPKKISIHAD